MNKELHIALRVCLSLGLIVAYLPLAVRRDDIATDLNGSLDTLKKTFHSLGAWIRALVFGVVGILAYYPIPAAILAYFILSASYFWCLFDPKLNVRDGKANYYVSRQPNAALADRFLVWLAAKLGREPEVVAPVFKMVLLALSLVAYIVTVLYSYQWAVHTQPSPI